KSAKYYDLSKQLAIKSGDHYLYNNTRIKENYILLDSDTYQAEKVFTEILNVSITNNDGKNIVECYNGLGIVAEIRNNLSDATEWYLKALKEAEKIKSSYHQVIVLNNLGLIKFYIKKYEEAKNDFLNGLELAEKLNNKRLALNLHNNLGLIA